jgi:hypothetical protein
MKQRFILLRDRIARVSAYLQISYRLTGPSFKHARLAYGIEKTEREFTAILGKTPRRFRQVRAVDAPIA